MHRKRRSKLIEAAAVCGPILGGGNGTEVEKIRSNARCIGLLYEVVDDILDITKSSEELGKAARKDLEFDKATYPNILGLKGVTELVEILMDEAEEELLSYFDAVEAAPLLHLAKYIGYRITSNYS